MKYLFVLTVLVFNAAKAFYLPTRHATNNGRLQEIQIGSAIPGIPTHALSQLDAADDMGGIRHKQTQLYMTGAEHALLRKTLQTAIRILDSEKNNDYNVEKDENSFYLQLILSLINQDINREGKRSRTKRRTFDSISHQAGLAGFRGYGLVPGSQRKRPFTFQELLPYLLNEMRRNSRDISTSHRS